MAIIVALSQSQYCQNCLSMLIYTPTLAGIQELDAFAPVIPTPSERRSHPPRPSCRVLVELVGLIFVFRRRTVRAASLGSLNAKKISTVNYDRAVCGTGGASAGSCRVPESWGGSEWLSFFTLAAIVFAMMIRLKVLKPRIGR